VFYIPSEDLIKDTLTKERAGNKEARWNGEGHYIDGK